MPILIYLLSWSLHYNKSPFILYYALYSKAYDYLATTTSKSNSSTYLSSSSHHIPVSEPPGYSTSIKRSYIHISFSSISYFHSKASYIEMIAQIDGATPLHPHAAHIGLLVHPPRSTLCLNHPRGFAKSYRSFRSHTLMTCSKERCATLLFLQLRITHQPKT